MEHWNLDIFVYCVIGSGCDITDSVNHGCLKIRKGEYPESGT